MKDENRYEKIVGYYEHTFQIIVFLDYKIERHLNGKRVSLVKIIDNDNKREVLEKEIETKDLVHYLTNELNSVFKSYISSNISRELTEIGFTKVQL